MQKSWMVIGGLVLSACSRVPIGDVGFLSRESEPIGTKMLRPGVTVRSCQGWILGVPVGPRLSMTDVVERILAIDSEGNAVTNARLSWDRMRTILYDRDCLEVRGDLVRTVATVTIPHHDGHEHHMP